MRVHCPHCNSPLTVHPAAAGKSGRCPMCRQTFVVPLADDLLDDAITELLEEDPPAPSGDDDIPPPPKPSSSVPMKKKRDFMPRKEPAAHAPVETKPKDAAKSGIQHRPDGKRVYVVRSAITHCKKAESDPDAAPSARPETPPPAAAPRQAAPAQRDDIIRLEPCGVNASGVHLRFRDSALMRVPFRASMPMWCIGCGEQDASKLVARPLAWVDRTHASDQNVGEVESHYSAHVKPGQTGREIVEAMNRLEHLHFPLNQTMPYYACSNCAGHISVDAISYSTSHGTQCEVTIPSGSYALEWLGRVNGIVGEEYEMLQQGVRNLETDAWRDLPDQVRERLAAWFSFQGGEHFLAFISDVDFPKKDHGLGGVVITDDRLVYCKYNHKGMIPLHGEGDLLLMRDALFTDLIQQHAGHQRKLVRIRSDDVQMLIDAMTTANTSLNILKVESIKGRVDAPPKLPADSPAPPAPPAPVAAAAEPPPPPKPSHPLPRIFGAHEP